MGEIAANKTFRNPGRHGTYAGPAPFETVRHLFVELTPTDDFGIQMTWRSDDHGTIATFPWWDHLESDPRCADATWSPVGTQDEPFVDAGQDWVFWCWRDNGFVYWVEGLDIASWERRVRVPEHVFDEAWRDAMGRLRTLGVPDVP